MSVAAAAAECKLDADCQPPPPKKSKITNGGNEKNGFDKLGPMPDGERTLQLRHEHVA